MSEYSRGKGYYVFGASKENVISIDNSQLIGDMVSVYGGSVAVSNQSLIQSDNSMGTSSSIQASAGELTFRDSKIRTPGFSFWSPRVTIDNSDIQLEDHLFISDSIKVDEIATPKTSHISLNRTNLQVVGRQTGSGNIYMYGDTITAKDSEISASGTSYMDANDTITLDNTKLSADYGVYIAGGKVDMINSSVNSSRSDASPLVIMAAELKADDDPFSGTHQMGGVEHNVTLTNTTVESGNDIWIGGGKVTLDDTIVTSGDSAVITAVESTSYAVEDTSYDDNVGNRRWDSEWTGTTGTGSKVGIKGGSSVSAVNQLAIGGREIEISDASTVSVGAANGLSVKTGERGTMKDYVITAEGAPGEIAVSTDSKLLQNGADVTDAIATRRFVPMSGPTPIPGPTPTPTPMAGETMAENVAIGKAAMKKIFENNTTLETLRNATRDWVGNINRASIPDTAKSGQITGAILSILNDSALADAEKVSLQRMIVDEFRQTANAKTETNNTVVSATGAARPAPELRPGGRSENEDDSPVTFG